MNKMKLFEAMNLIDDDLIKEASEDNVKPAADSSADKSITVSGVERYSRIAWHRLAAVASAVLLIAGLGAGGALMLKRRPPLLEETAESTTAEATAITEIKAEGSTVKNGSSSGKEVPADEEKTKESNDISEPAEAEKENDIAEDTAMIPNEEDNAVVTTAMQTALQWKTSPANASTLPKPTTVTTAEVHYPDEKVTTPATEPSKDPYISWQIRSDIHALTCLPEDTAWLNTLLSSLRYQSCTCDGLPEGIFNGSDGNVYQLNFSAGWIWRNGREEAPMPDEIRQYFAGINECP